MKHIIAVSISMFLAACAAQPPYAVFSLPGTVSTSADPAVTGKLLDTAAELHSFESRVAITKAKPGVPRCKAVNNQKPCDDR
jgi:hypothetical protein